MTKYLITTGSFVTMKKELKEIGTTAALAAAVVTTGTFVSQTTAQADVVAPEVATTNQANATLSVEQAQSAVASAEANVAKAQQHFDDASAAYSATQAQLGPASQQVASAQLSVASAAVALKSAQTETNQLIPDALTTNDRIAADEAASSAASERYSAAAEQVSAAGDAASQAHQAVSAHQIAVDQASSAVQVAQNVAAGVGKQEAQSALASATTTVASAQALVSDANAVLASAQAVANMAYEKGKSANAALSAARVEATDVHNQFYSADSIRWNAQGKLNSARERLDHAYMGEDVYASETAQAIASAEDTIERAQNNISYATSSIESSRSEYASASAYVPSAEAALLTVTQSVQSTSAELASAQSAYDTTQAELSAAQAAVAPAQAAFEQAEAELQTAQQAANQYITSGIKLPDGYVETLKGYQDGNVTNYALKEIAMSNGNYYQEKEEDSNRWVTLSYQQLLPRDIQIELTKYMMGLLNPIRAQFGTAEFTSNDAILQFVEQVVRYTQEDDYGYGLDWEAVRKAENESGLFDHNLDETFSVSYAGSQTGYRVSVSELKSQIYKELKKRLFSPDSWNGTLRLLGLSDNYNENELGIGVDDFGNIHLAMIGPNDIASPSEYQSIRTNSPIYTADVQIEGNNDQLNVELKEKKAAVDRVQAKLDQINSDVMRLANTSGELRDKISNLAWTNSTLAYDLHNAQEKLDDTKRSMEWAEESIKRSQEEIQSSQAELTQAQADLAKLQQDRPQTQQDIINRAKQELQQAQTVFDLADQKYQAATQLDQAKQKAVEQAQAVVDRLVAIARLADKNVEVAKQALADAQETLTQDQALQTQAQELVASYDWSPEAKAAALQKAQANLAAVEKQLAAATAEANAKDQALQQAQSEEAQARQAMDETAARLSGDHSQFNQVDAMYYQLVNLQEILVQAQTVLAALHVDHTQNLAALQQAQNEYVQAQQALELAKQRLAKAQATLAMVGMVDSTPDKATNTSGATDGTPTTTDEQNPAWNNGGGTGAPALDGDEDGKAAGNQSSSNDDTDIAVAGSSTEKSSSELPSGGTGAPSENDEWETTDQSTSTPDSTTLPASTTSDATGSNGSQAVTGGAVAGTGTPSETEPTPIATPAQDDPVKAEPTSQTNELPTLTGTAGELVTENDKNGADPSQPIRSANESLVKGAGEQNYLAQGTTGIGEPISDRDTQQVGAPHPSNNTVDTKLPQTGDAPTNLTLAQATGLAAATLLTGRAIRKWRRF